MKQRKNLENQDSLLEPQAINNYSSLAILVRPLSNHAEHLHPCLWHEINVSG